MNQSRRTGSGILAGCTAGFAALLLFASPTYAVENAANACDGTSNDPATCTGRTGTDPSVCMGNLFGGSLNCTANDVRIAEARNVRDPATGQPITTCVEGSTLNFKADFFVDLTAQARYDIGLYFATDGDPQADGARGGACSVSKITPTNSNSPINLDLVKPSPSKPVPQPGDSCGDIDDGHDPQTVTLTLSAACHAGPLFFNKQTRMCQATAPAGDTDPKHCVALPNCTSWRQTGANGVCDSPLDAFPGTTSKCNCDDTFGIPVIVETATLAVVKSVSPDNVPEDTGGLVHYTVQITNDASFVSVTINTLVDDIYGNLHDTTNPFVSNNTCPNKVGAVLAPGGSTSCTFDVLMPAADSGTEVKDTAQVCGTDSSNHQVCGDDDAKVTYTNSTVAPTLAKAATGAANCQLDVTYTVAVTNNSQFDIETLNSLTDDKFGVLTTPHLANVSCGANQTCGQVVSTTCGAGGQGNPGVLPATISPSQTYSCSFVGRIVSSSCSIRHVNTATGALADDDAVTANPSDTAQVNVDVTFP